LPARFEEFVREPRIPGRDTGIGRLARGEPLVHFTDVAAIDSDEAGDPRASVDLGGFEPQPNSSVGRLVRGENLIHIPDLMELAPRVPEDPVPRAAVELGGVRTLLMVPLRKDELLGAIVAMRREVRPFSENEIALLQNFAG
jgi:GAF domain-containing protein